MSFNSGNIPSLSELASKALLNKPQPKSLSNLWGFFQTHSPQPLTSTEKWALMERWNHLKLHEDETGTGELMKSIEHTILRSESSQHNPDTVLQDKVETLFQKLNFSLHSKETPQYYAKQYETLENEAVDKLYEALSQQLQMPPLTTTEAKKAWLDDPQNTPHLDSIIGLVLEGKGLKIICNKPDYV